ncbi:hypothetical protein I5Q12_19790 [Serratia marcescens]|nr:hypothetical protein [Serratia marcescens]MBH2817558.1 hypothetical protein [Serratia marcescens]
MIAWISQTDNWTGVAAWLGFGLSVYQLLKSRTTLKLYLGLDQYVDTIEVFNESAHDVTLSSAGVVTASGYLKFLSDEYSNEYMITPMLPLRLKARDEITLKVPRVNKAYENKTHHRGGVFVTTSDGKTFSDVCWLRRKYWWLLAKMERGKS